MKNLFSSILVAGALALVPATVFAQTCTFGPGDTIWADPQASDAKINDFLSGLNGARSQSGINTRLMAEQLAATMHAQQLLGGIAPECREPQQIAQGFLKVNGLPSSMSDRDFATRVRTTGFKLPITAAPAPPPPPAPPVAAAVPVAPVAPAVAAAVPAPVNYQPQIDKLQKQLEELKARPVTSLTDRERQQLASLPQAITELQAAQNAAAAAKRTAEEQAAKATDQATSAAGSAGTAASAATNADASKTAAERAAKAAQTAAAQAAASAEAAKAWSLKDWLLLLFSAIIALVLVGAGLFFFGGSSDSTKVDELEKKVTGDEGLERKLNDLQDKVTGDEGLEGKVGTLSDTVNTVKENVENFRDRLPPDIKLVAEWKDLLAEAHRADRELTLPILVETEPHDFKPKYVVTLRQVSDDEVEVLSGIQGHNHANLIKVANIPSTIRRAGFKGRLNDTDVVRLVRTPAA